MDTRTEEPHSFTLDERRVPEMSMSAATTTIVLADDHPIVREGLRTVLEREPDLSVVGEASDGAETLELVRRLKPKLLVLDVRMPGKSGLEVAQEIAQVSPQTRVLVLSMYAAEGYVMEALASGVAGYILKETDTGNLIPAIRQILSGSRYLSPAVNDHVIDVYVQRTKGGTVDPFDTLTARERQVLRLVAEGRTNAEISEGLSISVRTTEHHRANLMRKLKLKSGAEVVAFAKSRGIVPLQE
jgi:two-component system, NarL family, response regulator NreC